MTVLINFATYEKLKMKSEAINIDINHNQENKKT